MWFESTGKIIYDPYRGNLKKKPHWWCIVTVDKEITRYYRWWIKRHYHVKGLCEPSWNAHISVIRGEKPSQELMPLWKKYQGEKIKFKYQHYPKESKDRDNSGVYWYVEVECPFLLNIRKEFERPCDWSLHLTVARTWF